MRIGRGGGRVTTQEGWTAKALTGLEIHNHAPFGFHVLRQLLERFLLHCLLFVRLMHKVNGVCGQTLKINIYAMAAISYVSARNDGEAGPAPPESTGGRRH